MSQLVIAPAPLRIGIIANSLDALTLERGGGFVHIVETAGRWKDVTIVVMAPSSTEETFRKRMPVDEFIAVPDFGGGATATSMLRRAIAAAVNVGSLRRRCDVVLAMSHSIPDVLPAVLFGPNRAAVQLWHFIGNPLKREGSPARNLLAFANELVGRALTSWCKGYILGSITIGREMKVLKRPHTHVTTNGVDEILPPAALHRTGSIFVGRLHPAKGLGDLLRIWRLVQQHLPGERLTIVGRGSASYRLELERSIDEAALRDVVEIRDDVENEEKLQLLAASKVFVFPSREEGWGIAIAEAMALALPCVTYALPPFADLFPKGRLEVAIGDVAGFASRVVGLLSDASLYASLTSEALEQSKDFSWSRAADIELRALREIAR